MTTVDKGKLYIRFISFLTLFLLDKIICSLWLGCQRWCNSVSKKLSIWKLLINSLGSHWFIVVIITLYKPYKKNTFPPWTELSKKKGMTIWAQIPFSFSVLRERWEATTASHDCLIICCPQPSVFIIFESRSCIVLVLVLKTLWASPPLGQTCCRSGFEVFFYLFYFFRYQPKNNTQSTW